MKLVENLCEQYPRRWQYLAQAFFEHEGGSTNVGASDSPLQAEALAQSTGRSYLVEWP